MYRLFHSKRHLLSYQEQYNSNKISNKTSLPVPKFTNKEGQITRHSRICRGIWMKNKGVLELAAQVAIWVVKTRQHADDPPFHPLSHSNRWTRLVRRLKRFARSLKNIRQMSLLYARSTIPFRPSRSNHEWITCSPSNSTWLKRRFQRSPLSKILLIFRSPNLTIVEKKLAACKLR